MPDFAEIARWMSDGTVSEKVRPCRHFLNASSLQQCCLRERLLSYRDRKETQEEVPVKELFCRSFGTFYHSFIQTLLGDFMMCGWTCSKCGEKAVEFGSRPRCCPRCGGTSFAMSETGLFDRFAQVAGYCDGVVDFAALGRKVSGVEALDGFAEVDMRLVEIKTVGHGFFSGSADDEVRAVLPWKWQSNWYFRCLVQQFGAELSGIVLLLLDRQDFSVRLVPCEPDTAVMEEALAKALDFQSHRKAGALPPFRETGQCSSCIFLPRCRELP